MSTKSDVDVFVNGREIGKVRISVKYAGTKQAGQFAGVDAAKNLRTGLPQWEWTSLECLN